MKQQLVDLIFRPGNTCTDKCAYTITGEHCFCGANILDDVVCCCFCDEEDRKW